MVDEGMRTLTGEADLAKAWARFVRPEDIVGIKLNSGAGIRQIASRVSVVRAVIDGVLAAGVPDENIVVWDQIEDMLVKRYVKRNKLDEAYPRIRFKGCTPAMKKENYEEGKPLDGFETEVNEFPWGKVKVAELVAKELTAIVNIPTLKDHACSGVTLALKNISHAVVDLPWMCHDDSCDPYIADIVNIPAVRDKLRLHILDGLMGLAEGGPSLRSLDHVYSEEKLLLSADPVALDTVGKEYIIAARKTMGYPPLEEAVNLITKQPGRPPKHIDTAAKRGLGTNDLKRIELVKLEIPPAEEEEEEA
jgi:uncharacterized protein (DUF362 family)